MRGQWKYTDNSEEQLKAMLSIVAPYSAEVNMGNFLRELWRSYGCEVSTDVLGNVYGSLPGRAPIHIGLVAHMDTVGIQVTGIAEDGRLFFRNIGIDPAILEGQRVDILTSQGLVEGLIGLNQNNSDSGTVGPPEHELVVELAAGSREVTRKMVEIGDMGVLKGEFKRVGKSCISSSAIDNRVGIFIISECLRLFSAHGSPVHLHAVASVQEEMGLRGASVIARHKRFDACFIVDVDPAANPTGETQAGCGKLIVGQGVGLHRKADNNEVLQRIVRRVAQENSHRYQLTVGRRIYGGTDASTIQLLNGGIATVNINIPCLNVHSPNEICDTGDIETAVNLLFDSISRIAELDQRSFIPGVD